MGNGVACHGGVWGNFDINQIATDKAGNITLLDANFSQSCETPNSPKISGVVKYNARPLGFSIKSAPSNHFGADITKTFTNATSVFSLTGDKTSLTYTVSGNRDNWAALVIAPTGKTLKVGAYKTSNFVDNTHARLDIFRGTRYCYERFGDLEIKAISNKANGSIASLNASFVQYCANNVAALRGNIRYFE